MHFKHITASNHNDEGLGLKGPQIPLNQIVLSVGMQKPNRLDADQVFQTSSPRKF